LLYFRFEIPDTQSIINESWQYSAGGVLLSGPKNKAWITELDIPVCKGYIDIVDNVLLPAWNRSQFYVCNFWWRQALTLYKSNARQRPNSSKRLVWILVC
jgi:hypothetical protein